MEKEKVLDRVKKLLSLGRDKGATEAEQGAALAKAAMLLAEHGLTESQIDSAEYSVHRKDVVVGLGNWKITLAMAVANLYGAYITKNSRNASVTFYGPLEVIDASSMTFDWLLEQVNQMRDTAVRNDASIGGAAWGNNFKTAAVGRIYSRVTEILKGQNQSGTGNTLVVHTSHLQTRTRAILESKGEKFTKGKKMKTKVHSLDAFSAGLRAGDSVELTKAMGGKAEEHKALGHSEE